MEKPLFMLQSKKMRKKLLWIILLLMLADALYLQFVVTPYGSCTEKACDTVIKSAYAKPFGFPLSLLGVISSFVLGYLLLFEKNPLIKKLTSYAVILGVIGASVFFFLQIIIIKSLCVFCFVYDYLMFLFAIVYYSYQRKLSFEDQQ
ncbi:MAG: hypothetical protein UU76_C0006G0022 [Parcubacteria group bacterium GW2011_GWC1_41_7]|nr:MAG: hypothetical protein UU76_C0006G0022 [Parcubacteria group bacterium GW2011_GWC1_41_7]